MPVLERVHRLKSERAAISWVLVMNSLLQRLALNAAAAILALMMIHIALLMFALGIYFALEEALGRPAALIVAAVIFVGIAALCVFLLRDRARKPSASLPATTQSSNPLMSSLTGDVENFVRRHPAGSLGLSFVAGILLARNPALVGRLMRGFAMFGL
jgi:hypothetical protein